jgi:hypothetical protein
MIFDFSYRLTDGGIFKSASDSYRYKELKKLVDAGIFVSGLDIESSKLIRLLKVSDIRELAKSKGIIIKGKKKDDLLTSFLEQSSVDPKDIGKYLAIREIFAPNTEFTSKYDFSKNKETWEKSRIIAEYIEGRIHGHADAKEYGESFGSSFNKRFINSLTRKCDDSEAA